MSIQGIQAQPAQWPNHSSPLSSAPKSEQSAIGSPDAVPDKATEVCIASTDKVDGEIARLKAKESQLSQRLGASGNPAQNGEIEKELAQIENELRQKDNDTYRRQHTRFSSGVDLNA